ncbi:DUF397 domain-containing protein [Streptomyces mayteni]
MLTNDWQKSSFSADAANCVELRWQKSTSSGDAGNCLEVAAATTDLRLRESDEPEAILTTTPSRLAALLGAVKTADGGPLGTGRR